MRKGSLLVILGLAFLLIRISTASQRQGLFSESSQVTLSHSKDESPELLPYTAGGHVLGFRKGEMFVASGDHALRVEFVNARPVSPKEEAKSRDPESSRPAAQPLGKVSYPNLWDGVTLVYENHGSGVVKSTYRIEPVEKSVSSPLNQIRLHYNVPVKVDDSGDLVFSFTMGEMRESRPVAWQEIEGKRVPVEVMYRLRGEQEVGFKAGSFDPRYPLMIDPVLSWNTFLGGSAYDKGNGIAVDTSGNVYVTGSCSATWGSPVRPFSGNWEAFAAKLNGDGVLQWNTFLGGSGTDEGYSIAVDTSGNVYVTGYSYAPWGSPVFPFPGYSDAFVAKLNGGGALQWNTFLGGSGWDGGYGIAVDTSGNVYVTGESSTTWGSPVRPYTGNYDAFAAKLNGSGVLQWNAFLGGANDDQGMAIAVDTSGNVYVAGDSPATWGSPVRPFAGDSDAFVAKLNGGGVLQWNAFLGGSGDDYGDDIAVDTSGNVYVTGESWATWGSPVRPYTANYDAFAAKLNGDGVLQWNTFLGGSGTDEGYGIAVDTSGNVSVAGTSYATWGSPVSPYAGSSDAFAAKLNGSGALQVNAFLGGSGNDYGYGIAVDTSGNVYVTGESSTAWGSPVRPYTGNYDAFVEKFFSDEFSATLAVTSPNGGESWVVGSSHNITWTSTGTIANVKIEYSANNGTNWTTIIASTANTSSYAWTVPAVVSANCLVRVGEAPAGTPADLSNAVFAIIGVPAIGLSKSSLNFGAQAGGVSTKTQWVNVINTGEGTLAWTATRSAGWITVTPGNGTGGGAVAIGVNPAGLSSGTYTGSVAFADPNAANSPWNLTVNLTVYDSSGTLPPFGDFATPIDGTVGVTGAIPVTGWVLDDIGMEKLEIWRDPVLSAGELNSLYFIGNGLFVEGPRPDIETGYPNYPMNYAAGWGYMLLTNFLPNQGNGTYKLYAIATDKEGNQVTLGTKTITCDNLHAVKPFGTIDTPGQGGTASGNKYVNFGWVLTPLPGTVPKDGHLITVFVDGVLRGSLGSPPNLYNAYRPDVSNNFPGLNNTGGPGPGEGGPVGAFFLDTTGYANGVHTIFWIAYDDLGQGDGIGSRYFSIANVAGAPEPGPAAQVAELGELSALPICYSPIKVKTGFDLNAEFAPRYPDKDGIVRIEIPEVNRVEIELGDGAETSALAPGGSRFGGHMFAGDELRPLPIGSTLDRRTGRFSWMPGPGFVGTYDLLFVRSGAGGLSQSIRVRIAINPIRRGRH